MGTKRSLLEVVYHEKYAGRLLTNINEALAHWDIRAEDIVEVEEYSGEEKGKEEKGGDWRDRGVEIKLTRYESTVLLGGLRHEVGRLNGMLTGEEFREDFQNRAEELKQLEKERDTLLDVINKLEGERFRERGVEYACSRCGEKVLLPFTDEEGTSVSVEPLKGWTGPPMVCKDCSSSSS